MGNTRSSTLDENTRDIWWTNGGQHSTNETLTTLNDEVNVFITQDQEVDIEREQRRKELAEDFENFKLELARKHEKRRQILAEKRQEMTDIRDELILEKMKNEELRKLLAHAKENCERCDRSEGSVSKTNNLMTISALKEENEDLRTEIEKLRLHLMEKEIISEKNKELRISLAEMQKELQTVNTEVVGFQKERIDYQEHVTALKEVVKVSKEMLHLRENEIEELRKKITSIEELLASKEMNILSEDLRHEYERQLRNIRNLRTLYEERQRADKREKEHLHTQIEELKKNVEEEQQKNRELQDRVNEVEEENSQKYDKITNLESNLGLSKAECKELQAQMAIINQLFSQILLGFNNDQEINLDKLIKTLEENHDLLTNIVINEESSEVSALPKVLLDLVNQVNESKRQQTETAQTQQGIGEQTTDGSEDQRPKIKEENDPQLIAVHQLNSPQEIVENLPKVWRVLIELLSHQCAPNNVLIDSTPKTEESGHPCYKSIETPTGTRSVLSVSKTYIRLKDLILEKKFLEKEMGRLKQLNTHLEGRLQDQEKRLVLVSSELSKTWHVVGKMQKQHHQLHTQEKILRYELAQKRKLLTELKEELEYCRDKWLEAKKKNSTTEEQWKQLKTEFTSRKTGVGDDYSNSVESGYSDDKSSSEDEGQNINTDIPNRIKNIQEDSKEGASETKGAILKYSGKAIAECSTENMSSPILNVVKNEIAVIEETLTNNGEASPASETLETDSTNEVSHSLETQKTDLVQNVTHERQENSVLRTCNEQELDNDDFIVQINDPLDLFNTEESTAQLVNVNGEMNNAAIDISVQLDNLFDNAHTENVNSATEITSPQSTAIIKNVEKAGTSAEHEIDKDEKNASTSSTKTSLKLKDHTAINKTPSESAEEFVARREERMKRLEEQCQQLFCKVASNSIRSIKISTKLDNLHETYGESAQEEVPSSNISEIVPEGPYGAEGEKSQDEEMAASSHTRENLPKDLHGAQGERSQDAVLSSHGSENVQDENNGKLDK